MKGKTASLKTQQKTYRLSQLHFLYNDRMMKPKNEMHPEIDKFPLKPDKWSEKQQGSHYYRNVQISAVSNDEYLKTDCKNTID